MPSSQAVAERSHGFIAYLLHILDIVPEIVSFSILPSVWIWNQYETNMKIIQIIKGKANILGVILQYVYGSTRLVCI